MTIILIKHINYLLIRNPYTRIISSFYAMTIYLLKHYNSYIVHSRIYWLIKI